MVAAMEALDVVQVTFTVIEQVLLNEPLVPFQVIVVTPLFNCTPLSVVPVPVVAPLRVYDKVGTLQLPEAVALNSVAPTTYLQLEFPVLVNGLPEGQVTTGALDATVIVFVELAVPQGVVTWYFIIAVPADTPVTAPVDAFTVAAAELLLHVPPVVPLVVKLYVNPAQTVDAPPMVPPVGSGLTVSAFNADLGAPQPVLTVYVILVAPAPTGVTTPEVEFTVATAVLLLLHVPPLAPLLVKVVAGDPTHTGEVPLTVPALTRGFTVTDLVAVVVQPAALVTVYFTVTVPAVIPVTVWLVEILAEPVPFDIDQVPPLVVSVKAAVVALTHTVAAPPPIAATVGRAFTVRALVTAVVNPQLLVTEYLTVTLPAVVPVTTLPLIVAAPVPFTIDHVPPAVASVKAGVAEPTHTAAAPPPIAATTGVPAIVTLVVVVLEQVPLVKL